MNALTDNNNLYRRASTRGVITSWGYRHLRFVASVRFAVAAFLLVVGCVLAFDGHFGWAALPLAFAVVHVAWGSWQLSVARSASSRT
jgi:hypothetical protein